MEQHWSDIIYKSSEYNELGNKSVFGVNLMLDMLPIILLDQLSEGNRKVLNWNCGIGAGIQYLHSRYPNLKPYALDTSVDCIDLNIASFPNITFLLGTLANHKRKYDIIYSIDVLNTIDEYLDAVIEQMDYSNEYVIVLVPFNDREINENNKHTFNNFSFPNQLRGFRKVVSLAQRHRDKHRLLVVYRKK